MVDQVTLTAVDFIILAILLISALFALVRGFVQEVLSVSGWIGAGIITYYGFRPFSPILRNYIEMSALADVLTGIGIFVISLVVLSFVSHAIGRRVRGSSINALDRSLGFLFGIGRGAVVVVAIFMFTDWAVPKDEQPDWWRNAKFTPYADHGSTIIRQLLPQSVRDQGIGLVDDLGTKTQDVLDQQMSENEPDESIGIGSEQPDIKDKLGYKGTERKALEFIIRNSRDE